MIVDFESFVFAAIKEERFRFGNGYDQVEDVIGVAQPVRFNSKRLTLPHLIVVNYMVVESALCSRTQLSSTTTLKFLFHPQRNAPAGGTTTRRQPAATKCT